MWTAFEGHAGLSAGGFPGNYNGGLAPIGLYGMDGAPFAGRHDVHRSLWTAVVLRALQDATRRAVTDDARRIKDEARGWFVDAGGDFHRVCRMAGLDPSWVRGQAIKLLD